MIWSGIAAGGFCPGELAVDRFVEAALAGETASAAAANARTSLNRTVMGESLGAGGSIVWSRARGITFKTATPIAVVKAPCRLSALRTGGPRMPGFHTGK